MSAPQGVAERIRQLRAERGWSAQRLAAECAALGSSTLTRGTIAKIESGVRKSVTAEEIDVLGRAFGVELNALVRGADRSSLASLMQDLYPAPAAAHEILLRVGLPETRIPDFESSANFWSTVIRGLENGVIVDGVRKLIEQAHRDYPGNARLLDVIDGVSRSDRPDTPVEGASPTATVADIAAVVQDDPHADLSERGVRNGDKISAGTVVVAGDSPGSGRTFSDVQAAGDNIPAPPALYAEPRYIGSHSFVGRAAQLAALNDWATLAEAHPVLLLEGIGGTGKSMLAWEWVTRQARAERDDWAGMFWYSFYEKGALMADFCRRALAYMTGQSPEALRKKKLAELTDMLAHQLHAQPWLLVLDGLERVLVAYHRYDAAQIADEQAGRTDEIANRDPRSAIRPSDDDLLRQLAAASPSKILITSRLVPQGLLNAANQPIPGVLSERLPGLRPTDAEALLRSCGVHGDSHQIQDYLQRHCDCHPLVTGIVGGLVNDYLPDRGNFDAWAADPGHGGRLELAHLDLVQKRNHILTAALQALPDASHQLLSTLSLLPESVDYAVLAALNPHLLPEPVTVPEPDRPEDDQKWEELSPEGQGQIRREYAAAGERRRAKQRTYAAWQASPKSLEAAAALTGTVRDLEQRGLLQYDRQAGRWDLHPVVRAVTSSGLRAKDRDLLGQRIIDLFSSQPHGPYEQAVTFDDLRGVITVVRTLLQMGRTEDAWDALQGDLIDTLLFNLEAYAESLSLLRPLFPYDWSAPKERLSEVNLGMLAHTASLAFSGLGELMQSAELDLVAVRTHVAIKDWRSVWIDLANLSKVFCDLNRLALSERYSVLALRLAEVLGDPVRLFIARLNRFQVVSVTGRWHQAEELWTLLDPMGRDWPRSLYRPGDAEQSLLEFMLFPRGRLTEEELSGAERLARNGQNRKAVRVLHRLRGEWRLARGEHALAAESLQEAIRMSREAGLNDHRSETLLALARLYMAQLPAAHEDAVRLSGGRNPAHLVLALLWLALEDTEQAIKQAQAAYRDAWADGEPYVRRHDLDHAKALLRQLGRDIPELPSYDPTKSPEEPWEHEVAAEITKLGNPAQPGLS